MAKTDCVALAVELAKGGMGKDEARALVQGFEREAQIRKGELGKSIAEVENEMAGVAGRIADQAQRDALLAKRRVLLNALAERNVQTTVQRFVDAGLTRHEGLQAYLVGSNKVVKGALLSVEAQQRQSWSRLLGKLSGDLNKLGDKWKLFTNPDAGVGKKIAQELFEIDRKGGKPGVSGDANAQAIAKVLADTQELARRELNAAGADIGKMPGYIVMQEHEPSSMLAAGVKQWREFTSPHVDMVKTFGTTDPETVRLGMDAIFRHITLGTESDVLKTLGDGEQAYIGPANLANPLKAHRIIHFKDGEAWHAYNERFGHRYLHEAVISGLERAGKNIALLKNLTDNPENFIKKMANRYQEDVRNDPKLEDVTKADQVEKLGTNGIMNLYKQLSGDINRGGSVTVANIGAGVRAFQYLRLMGKVFFSQFADTANMLSELRYQGQPVLGRYANLFGERIKMVDKGQHPAFYDYLGTAADCLVGTHASRFHANDSAPGITSRLIATMNKMNTMNWWDRGWNRAMGAATSKWLAHHADLEYKALPESVSRLLGQYDIGEREWPVMRQAVSAMEDGRSYMTSEALQGLPNSEVAKWLGNEGATTTEIARGRDELMTRLETLITNRATYGILRPGARTTRWTTWNLPRGDALGEVARSLMQFKSFALASYEKGIERELYGYGGNSLKSSLLNGTGAIRGLAHYLVLGSVFGYVAMTAKDLTRGMTPRNPLDPKTIAAAMLQSGGLGIYGDFLFGKVSRYGNSMWANLLGPTVGSIEDVKNLWDAVRSGDEKAGQIFRFAINNLPFANLYYTRIAMDYLMLYDAQEALNPGSLRRMEGNAKKNNGNEFILPPSQNRLHPFTG